MKSGLFNLLQDGCLSEKGFPEIKTVIDQSGKKACLVITPFLEKKGRFSKEETEETFSFASVRVHVERIMQLLRIYKILDKIPHKLFKHIDKILHICYVLVNMQPPIFFDKADKTGKRKRCKQNTVQNINLEQIDLEAMELDNS